MDGFSKFKNWQTAKNQETPLQYEILSKGLFIRIKNISLKAQVHILMISRTVYERVKVSK